MGDDYMDVSSYSTDTITLTNDYNTVTINEDSGFTLQGMTSSSGTVSIDTTMLDNSIRIGNTKLTEDELKDYFDYYKLNSANYWMDFLRIKSEHIIRKSLKNHKNLYKIAKFAKNKIKFL